MPLFIKHAFVSEQGHIPSTRVDYCRQHAEDCMVNVQHRGSPMCVSRNWSPHT